MHSQVWNFLKAKVFTALYYRSTMYLQENKLLLVISGFKVVSLKSSRLFKKEAFLFISLINLISSLSLKQYIYLLRYKK